MPPLISSEECVQDMKSSNCPDTFFKKTCPVCGNVSPRWLFVDDYGDVVGCDDCLRVEYVEEP